MFQLLLIAQGFSLLGGYIQAPVLSWLAADLSGGLYALSAYLLACYLPVAILSYPLGRFLDGRRQKPWLPVLYSLPSIWRILSQVLPTIGNRVGFLPLQ